MSPELQLWVLQNADGRLCPAFAYNTEYDAIIRRDALNARLEPHATQHQPFTVVRLHATSRETAAVR